MSSALSEVDVLAQYADLLRGAGPIPTGRGPDQLEADGDDPVTARIRQLGLPGLRERQRAIDRYVEEDGVTYGVGRGQVRGRRWRLDPLPVHLDAQAWGRLETGLAQRARLLDALLRDLYGRRRVLAQGAVPAAVVFGNLGFIPAADGTVDDDGPALVLPAFDLAQAQDRSWRVISDRSQAPSGAGYAMADRRLVARAMPSLYRQVSLSRLRGFFDSVRRSLTACSPRQEEARVVLLSPGPGSETAFDQAFLASLLGIAVVQAEDLTARDGAVWLTGSDREDRVDVILRRVDEWWSDPLDLRSDSQLGVPGLLEAVRQHTVRVVNPIGAGVLESAGLEPFLPAACRMLLGEELMLRGPRTWWCAAPDAAGALERLEQLIAKPVDDQHGSRARPGWTLTDERRRELRAEISARPAGWVLQEPVAMGTVPVVTAAGLEPRRLLLRAFGVALDGEYRFLPGGLGRVTRDVTSLAVSSSSGSAAKDVWVQAPAAPQPLVVRGARPVSMVAGPAVAGRGLPPRVADDLFWLGRYAERAEATTRLLLAVHDLMTHRLRGPESPGTAVTEAMLQAAGDMTGRQLEQLAARDQGAARGQLRDLTLDESSPGTLAFAVAHLVQDAQATREVLPGDTWLVLSRIEHAIDDADEVAGADLRPVLAPALESLIALSGLVAEGMPRDPVWAFLDAGRRVERAVQLVALLRRTLSVERSPVIDGQVTEAVLQVANCLPAYRRRLAGGHGPTAPVASAVRLLLLDIANPRSVDYQLERLADALGQVPGEPLTAAVSRLQRVLHAADPEDLAGPGRERLGALLRAVDQQVRDIAVLIERTHFVRPTPHRSMLGSDLRLGGAG